MKRFYLSLALAFALTLCTSAWAQSYNFLSVNNPGDPNSPFTQLLGINNSNVIAGYHNFLQNQGFTRIARSLHHRELSRLDDDPGHRHQQQPDDRRLLCRPEQHYARFHPHQ